MFVVTTPASSRSLLSQAELRAAIGVTDNSQDTALATIGARVAAMISGACRVARSGQYEPTLLSETITETFRLTKHKECLIPARRFAWQVNSLSIDGVAQTTDDYELEPNTGLIYRLSDDARVCWPCGKIVAVYKAGFPAVPEDLKLAASKLVSELYTVGTRDPNLRRVKIEGVSEREYWIPPTKDPAISQEVKDMLAPYTTITVA